MAERKQNQSINAEENVVTGPLDLSSLGISHVQLETPEGLETLKILSDDAEKINGKKNQRPKLKEHSTKKIKDLEDIRVTYELDINDLPKYDITHRGDKSQNE